MKTIDNLNTRIAIAEKMIQKLVDMVAGSRAKVELHLETIDEFLLTALELDDGKVLVKGLGPGGDPVSYQLVTTGVGETEASVAVALAAKAAGGGPGQAQDVGGGGRQASKGIGQAAERTLDDVMDME